MTMKKLVMSMLMLVMAGSISFAQIGGAPEAKTEKTDLSEKVPMDKKVRYGKLDNGFTYYIRANKKPENRVQFRLVTNAGSILEDEAQRGLAHFCEHMAFNGTEQFKGNTMISELQKNGIEFGRGINAYTSFDETVYYVDLPSDKPEMVEMGFRILDGWAGRLLFDPQELESERGVIHEEWRGGLGANQRLQEATWAIMLKGSKYAERMPIGLESVIMGFKRPDIVRFYHDWYRPDLQAVVIVGDLDVDAAEAKVKEYFGKHAKAVNPKPRGSYEIPDNVEPLIAIAQDKEATSTQLQMFWKHNKPSKGTVGDYRQSLVRSLINGMLSERFAEMCQKASAPMVGADAGYTGYIGREKDVFMLYAAPKDGKIAETVELLLTEMRRIDQHGFLQTELDRQKEALLSSYKKHAKEAGKTQNVNFADECTRHYLEGEVMPGIRQEYKYAKEFIPGITLDEVNKMVATWITDENMVFSLTAPSSVKVMTEAEVHEVIEKTKHAETTPWVDNFKDEPLYSKVLPEVTPKVTKVNKALDYTEYTLPNGIRFIVKQTNYKADQIQMDSYAWGGTSLYEDNEILTAQLAAGIIDGSGIAGFDATQLNKKLKGKMVGISPSVAGMTQGFSGSCSPQDFETMMQLLNLYYEAPRKDQEAFDRTMEALRNRFKFMGENPQTIFMKKFYETIYPGDKRTIVLPTEEQMNSINLDRAYEIYKERYTDASNQTFFFVGNISEKEIALAAKYLNNLPCNGKQKAESYKNRSPKFAEGVNHVEVKAGTDPQGLMIVYGETEGFEATPKNKVMVGLLGDAMTITATEIIRETNSITCPLIMHWLDTRTEIKFPFLSKEDIRPSKGLNV